MKKPLFFALILLTTMPLGVMGANKPLSLIPLPVSVERDSGSLPLAEEVSLVLPDGAGEDWLAPARVFAAKMTNRYGVRVILRKPGESDGCAGNIIAGPAAADCSAGAPLAAGDIPPAEGYKLSVGDGIVVYAETPHGMFNGFMTLLQLIEPGKPVTVPRVRILDYPRFGWRGMLLDPARSFLPPDVIRKYLDILSELKLNVLHWHLVDDQGWRIESKVYPRLHEIGGKGQYYTQEQLKELVAYAAERQILVVPEIDVPGHSSAMLSAYPELSCGGQPVDVRGGPGIYRTALCPGKEEVYVFLDNLFGELKTIFPGQYVHIGSDEVKAGDWMSYPPNQAIMKEHGLEGQDGLQSYFVKRVNDILIGHDKTMIGWDEITSYLPTGSVVQAWRFHSLAAEAARKGHDSVVSPTSHCYIDYGQLSFTSKNLYGFEPIPEGLEPELQSHILGGEVNLWGERVTLENIDKKAFPRVVAHSEVMWTPAEKRDWKDYNLRLRRVKKDMKERGVMFGTTWRDILLLP